MYLLFSEGKFIHVNTKLYLFTTIGEACIHLELDLELETGSSVSEEQIRTAVKFGVDLERDSTDVKKYIVVFLEALLHQGEKLKIGVLDQCIQSAIKTQWEEVLCILQGRGRRLVKVQSGSLFFTLFCRTTESIEQLQDGGWRERLTEGLRILFFSIGMPRYLVIVLKQSLSKVTFYRRE